MVGTSSSGVGKGKTNNPNGRKAGVPNKVTQEIKEAYRNLLELNTPNMIGWLERVALVDPDKAIDLCIKMSEFVIPKLARVDSNHSGQVTSIQVVSAIPGAPNDKPNQL
jgi:hypothetical protein